MKIKHLALATALALMLAAAPVLAQTGSGPALTVIPSFAPVAEKAGPAVVNISATRTVKNRPMRLERSPFGLPNGPFGGDDFFDRFFGGPGGPGGERKANSLGSGFIFDPAGFIVTNNHVVEGADEIKVTLTDGKEIQAEIIGRDPKTDLALIKLKESGNYPYLALGDSDQTKIGDWVVAIGNPYGLQHTVTAGILSARGRSIGLSSPYDDFLQTDASINPGNSGGPLLNLSGEVIGINTAIVAGGTGIGFAIPANLAKGVVGQLKDKGRVVRGWMGAGIQDVTPELAKSYGLEGEARGALIREVDKDGPAGAAKIKTGDIVLKFDGHDIKDVSRLQLAVGGTQVGKKVKVVVFRDGKELTLDLTVGEMKDDGTLGGESGGADAVGKLGLSVREITPEMATRQNLSEREGLYIGGIEAGSPAAQSSLSAGDIILEIDNKNIKSLDDYRKAVNSKKKDDILRFLIKRGSNTMFFTITVGE